MTLKEKGEKLTKEKKKRGYISCYIQQMKESSLFPTFYMHLNCSQVIVNHMDLEKEVDLINVELLCNY